MTEVPNTPAPSGEHTSTSVVVEANATVKKSRLPMVLGALVVAGLVAFTIVYFATRDEQQAYQPGPEATAVAQGLKTSGIEVALADDELKCIDSTFAGYDVAAFDGGFDPFAGDLDEEASIRAGAMFDECLQQPSRLAIVAGSMSAGGFASDEKAQCAAKGFDQLVLDNGGYTQALGVSDQDLTEQLLAIFSDCGVDLGSGGATDSSPCEVELKVLQTATEAYFADTGTDATGWDDLVPEYLREEMSDRWEFVPASGGSAPTFVGLGVCEGYEG